MRLCVILLVIVAMSALAWDFVGPKGDWLSAKWLPRGELLLTGPNYRGLFIYYGEDHLDTVTLDWKAGYRPVIHDVHIILVFTGYKDMDGPGRVQVYDLLYLTTDEIFSGRRVGPPSFNERSEIVFWADEAIYEYSKRGVMLDMYFGGANITLPVIDDSYFYCDNAGIAYHYNPLGNAPNAIALEGEGRFAFSPVVSLDKKWVAFEDIGGAVFLYNVSSREVIELPKGDLPIFIKKPFGVLQLQLEDDGEEITSSKIVFVRIEDGKIAYVKDVLESAWKHIITHIDYRSDFGLLLTTRDGRIIYEPKSEEMFSK